MPWALALKDELLDYDGDFFALPARLPVVRSSVVEVEVETLRSRDQEDRPMVMVRIRTMAGSPNFLLLLTDPRPPDLAALGETLERVVEAVEVLVAGAYDALGYDA